MSNIKRNSAIKWHDAKTDLPNEGRFVLGYDKKNKIYSVVSWDGVFWRDRFFYCVDIDYWTDGKDFMGENTMSNIKRNSEIKWYNAKNKRPERNKYVVGYDHYGQSYAVVSWDGINWVDENCIWCDVTHWAELPEVII